MYEINDRLKAVRKDKGLTQEEFGNALGTGRGWVTNIEHHKKEPEEAKVNLACERFNINKDWLLTGEGPMLIPMNKTEEIAKVVGEIMKQSDDSFKKRFVAMIAALEPEDWELLEKIAKKLNEPE